MFRNVRISVPLNQLLALLQLARRGASSMADDFLIDGLEAEIDGIFQPARAVVAEPKVKGGGSATDQ